MHKCHIDTAKVFLMGKWVSNLETILCVYWDWTNKYIVDESQFLTGEERSYKEKGTANMKPVKFDWSQR